MTAKALVIPVTGHMSEIEWPAQSPDQLRALYRAIGCRTVTVIPGTHDTITVWADDDGLLIQAPELNARASVLCRGPVVGTVVVSGGSDSDGDTLPLSDPAHMAVLMTVDQVRG